MDIHSFAKRGDCSGLQGELMKGVPVGGLGYQGSRRFGVTPIFRLDCETWKIEAAHASGDNPGWIHEHKARLTDPGTLEVSGGKICKEVDAEEQHVENTDVFRLNVLEMTWTKCE